MSTCHHLHSPKETEYISHTASWLSERHNDRRVLRNVLPVAHSSQIEQHAGSNKRGLFVVLVGVIHHLAYPALYNEFGALVTREEGHVEPAPLDAGLILVQYALSAKRYTAMREGKKQRVLLSVPRSRLHVGE